MFRPKNYLNLEQTAHGMLFEGIEFVWDALPKIEVYLRENLKPEMRGKRIGSPVIEDDVFIGEGTVIEPGAYIKGPAWIGANCQVRHGAYIRGQVIVGDGCVLGNSCEFKNCVLFNETQVPHFSYVGDSILGHKAHLGAGVILSNVRLDRNEIRVRVHGRVCETGLRKLGAIVGDCVEIGCNCVVNPGSLLGRASKLMPGTAWTGALEEGATGCKR